ncbi:putative tRNA (guanine(26)-N(2))-dimethyltransferase 2, partial [Mucuna pruriens]
MDLNDYKIIKEGNAEILMHIKNEVNNRDVSIAVLRAFISKREQEHEAILSKRTKAAQKVSESDLSEPVVEDGAHTLPPEDHIDLLGNVKHKKRHLLKNCTTEQKNRSRQLKNAMPWERKVQRELKPPRVLEALSASGLRALRYAREIEGIGQVVALDNDKASVDACRRNIKFNGSVACSKVESHLVDARVYMLTHPKEFDVVDLDPYGSPSVFLDSAVQSVCSGGETGRSAIQSNVNILLAMSFCSTKNCHGMALRILLASIKSHANRYKRYIVPVLSVQMDFYVRFCKCNEKYSPKAFSYVYQCTGCDAFHLQPIGRRISKGPVVSQECNYCGKKFNMGGPIWSASIHDQEWVTSIHADVKFMKDRYPAYDRIWACVFVLYFFFFRIPCIYHGLGFLSTELPLLSKTLVTWKYFAYVVILELPRVPLFLSLHNLCATLKCTSPSAVILYLISGTHVNPLGLKSDAPMDVIWDIMRCWVRSYELILLKLYRLLARRKLRRFHAFVQILKGTGVLNLGQDVKLLASMSLFWVKQQLMEYSIRKRMKKI